MTTHREVNPNRTACLKNHVCIYLLILVSVIYKGRFIKETYVYIIMTATCQVIYDVIVKWAELKTLYFSLLVILDEF